MLFLLISVSTPSQSQTDKPLQVVEAENALKSGSYAIVVGINNYLSDNITDLKYCENDARAFADVLIKQGWEQKKVRLITGSTATFENIYRAVNTLADMENIPSDSSIIFYFSGHGVAIDQKNYLVPYDGTAEKSIAAMRNIQIETIEEALAKCSFARKLLFIDACRNEFSRDKKEIGGEGFIDPGERKGMKVFFATEFGSFSSEDDNLKMGVFTKFLTEGMSGPADVNKDGVIVSAELELYTAEQMKTYSFQKGKVQKMVTRGECDPLVPLAIVPVTDPIVKQWLTNDIPVVLKGERTDYDYELITKTVKMQIEGKKSVMEKINTSIFKVELDVSLLSEGLHNIGCENLHLSIPQNISLASIQQAYVEVRVSKKGTSTPISPQKTQTKRPVTSLSAKPIRTLSGHTNMVNSVAFSPDSSILASGSDDHTISLWSVASGAEILTLPGHPFYVRSVAFSPDGRKLASGSWDKTVKIWSVESGTELRTLSGHTGEIESVAFSPDGSILASGSHDHTIKLWSVASGTVLRTLSGHSEWVVSVTFSPDGSMLASGSYDKTIKIWEIPSGTELRTFSEDSNITSVAFNPDSSILVAGGSKVIRFYSIGLGTLLRIIGTYPALSVAFSPDGKMLASGNSDFTIDLFAIEYK